MPSASVSIPLTILLSKMTKTQILKVIKETAAPHKLNREQKFQVFANVCDNMLAEGRITQEQHIRWTNIF
jgi:hypothetical protein